MEDDKAEIVSIVGRMALIPMGRSHKQKRIVRIMRSVFNVFSIPVPSNMRELPSGYLKLGSRAIVTLFGYIRGNLYLAVQEDPSSHPVLFTEYEVPTNSLAKEMASGRVRISLEIVRDVNRGPFCQKPVWTMYHNGRKIGDGMKRICCSEADLRMIRVVQAASMGAAVLRTDDGELMYVRATINGPPRQEEETKDVWRLSNLHGRPSTEPMLFKLMQFWNGFKSKSKEN